MRTAFLWLTSKLTNLLRTVSKYACRKHLYIKDVDGDHIPEIVLDVNGSEQTVIEKEENKYDK